MEYVRTIYRPFGSPRADCRPALQPHVFIYYIPVFLAFPKSIDRFHLLQKKYNLDQRAWNLILNTSSGFLKRGLP